MTDEIDSNPDASSERRRVLSLLSGLGLFGLLLNWRRGPAPARERPQEFSLREADFYRPHGHAG